MSSLPLQIENDQDYLVGQTVNMPGFGKLTDYKTKDGKKQVIRKVLDTSQISSFQAHFHIMNRLVKLFPAEFARVSNYHRLTGTYNLIEPNNQSQSLYFEDSAVDLDKISQYLRDNGERFTEQDIEAVLGFFVMAGLTMEESLGFHPAVTPQNVLLIDCKLALYSPLIYDGFAPRWVQQIVDPVCRYGNSWSQEWTSSLEKREAQAIQEGPKGKMRLILDNHRELLQGTIQRMFATLLSLTSLEEVDPNNQTQIRRAASVSYNHYSKGLVDFILGVIERKVASFKELENMVAKMRSSVLRSFSFNVMTSNNLKEDPGSVVQEAVKAIQAGHPDETEFYSVSNAHIENESLGQNQSLQLRNNRLNRTLPIFDEQNTGVQFSKRQPASRAPEDDLWLGPGIGNQVETLPRNPVHSNALTLNGSLNNTVSPAGRQTTQPRSSDLLSQSRNLLQQRFDPRGAANQQTQATQQQGLSQNGAPQQQQTNGSNPLMNSLARVATDPRLALGQTNNPNQAAILAPNNQPSNTQQTNRPGEAGQNPQMNAGPAPANQSAGNPQNLQRPPPPPNFNQNGPAPQNRPPIGPPVGPPLRPPPGNNGSPAAAGPGQQRPVPLATGIQPQNPTPNRIPDPPRPPGAYQNLQPNSPPGRPPNGFVPAPPNMPQNGPGFQQGPPNHPPPPNTPPLPAQGQFNGPQPRPPPPRPPGNNQGGGPGPQGQPQPPLPTNYRPYLENIITQQQETLQQLREMQKKQEHLSLEQKKEIEQLKLLQEIQRTQGQEITKLAQIQAQIEDLAKDHNASSLTDLLSSPEYLKLLEEKEELDSKIKWYLSNGGSLRGSFEGKRRPTVNVTFDRDRFPEKKQMAAPHSDHRVAAAVTQASSHPRVTTAREAAYSPDPTAQWNEVLKPADTLQSDFEPNAEPHHTTSPRNVSRVISDDIRNGPATRSYGTYQTFQPSRPVASRAFYSSVCEPQPHTNQFSVLSPKAEFSRVHAQPAFEASGKPAKRIIGMNVYSVQNDSPPMTSTAPKTHTVLNLAPMTRAVRILQPSLVSAPVRATPLRYTSTVSAEPMALAVRAPEARLVAHSPPFGTPLRNSFSFAERPAAPFQASQRLLRTSPLRSSSLAPALDPAPQIRRISPLRPVTRTVVYPPNTYYTKT